MVSIVLVNFHCSALTCKAIHSIEEKIPLEIIVVDNSESESEVYKLRASLGSYVRIIVSDTNIGFGRACNLALNECQYDFVFLLNPDTFLIKNSLANLLSILKSRSDIAAVSPQSFWDMNCHFYLPAGQMQSPMWEIKNALAFRFGFFREMLSENFYRKSLESVVGDVLREQDMLSGGHLMIKKSVLKEIGGLFDESIFMYFEDTDLCFRIKEKNYKMLLVPSARVIHFWENRDSKNTYQEVSKQYFYKKHFHCLSLYRLLKKFIERFRLSEPAEYINLGDVLDFDAANAIINKNEKCTVEFAFHYTFVPSVLILKKYHEQINLNTIVPYLKNAEYWIKVREGTKRKILRLYLKREK